MTFVAVADETIDTTLLCEIVVHEAIRALDVSPLGLESLLAEPRRALVARVADVERALWSACIAGERTRGEVVRELVEALAPTGGR